MPRMSLWEGFTKCNFPRKPSPRRFSITMFPTLPGVGVAPITAMDFGLKKASNPRMHAHQDIGISTLGAAAQDEKSSTHISPVPRWTMGTLAGSGTWLCILWNEVCDCHADALISLIPR